MTTPTPTPTVIPGAECRNLLMRCINAAYLTSIQARGSLKCPHCDYSRECNNHFCLACMEGGLCPMQFRDNGAHHQHPWIQMRKVTHQLVVNANEVEHFLGDNACKIQRYLGNGAMIYSLRTKQRAGRGKMHVRPYDIVCGGCDTAISKTTTTKVGVLVCSIECLVKYADRKRQLQHVALREGVNLREPYVFPMTAQEKVANSREIRVPIPLRLRTGPAPAAAPQHRNGDGILSTGDVVAEMENNGDGAEDRVEVTSNAAAVEPAESDSEFDYTGASVVRRRRSSWRWPGMIRLCDAAVWVEGRSGNAQTQEGPRSSSR